MLKNNNSKLNLIFEILLVLFLISILYSKSLLSIIMGVLFFLSFFKIDSKYRIRFKTQKDIYTGLRSYFKSNEYLAVSLIFVIVVISGINSSNLVEWKHHLILKLPFLILPYAFFNIGYFTKDFYYRLYYYFIAIMFFSSIPIIINYFNNKDLYDNGIKMGQIIPTPIDHIKYSLMLSISILSSLYFILSKNYKSKIELIIFSIIVFFNFIVLHLLAVRSGIIISYVLLVILITFYLWNKNKLLLLFLSITIFLAPILSYKTFESFKNRIDYMFYDYKMFNENKGEQYSDSGRIYSIKVGLDIFKKNPLSGTGIGDIKTECIKTYKTLFSSKVLKFKYPHNQYLFILSSSGIIGLILFLIGVIFPLYIHQNWKEPLYLGFMMIILISFLVENTIERSYSIGLYLFFVLSALNYSNSDIRFSSNDKSI